MTSSTPQALDGSGAYSEEASVLKTVQLMLTPDQSEVIVENALAHDKTFVAAVFGDVKLDHLRACQCIVAMYGTRLLARKNIRTALLENCSKRAIETLFGSIYSEEKFSRPIEAYSIEQKRDFCRSQAWERGSKWAMLVCEMLGLPTICAGYRADSSRTEFECIDPFKKLGDLHPYQREVRERLEVLLKFEARQRAMIALPTGSGKTRVLVETLLDWPAVERGERAILWVAQHEELCDQAIQCFADSWRSRQRPNDRRLRIQRVWGQIAQEIDPSADIIVGIPETLDTRLPAAGDVFKRRLLAIVIDEAHEATEKKYKQVFKAAIRAHVIGISATPAVAAARGQHELQKVFYENLILAPSLGRKPMPYLQREGILAKLEHEELDSGCRFELDLELREELEKKGDIPSAILTAVGKSVERNKAIFDRLIDIGLSVRSVLCFTSSVASARALAAALVIAGRTAAAIDASTHRRDRQDIISAFKDQKIQFLLNFGVLATGFDAPMIECLVMARPTSSPVLLEQMIGRGTRGPRNGGTECCKVIWVRDQFKNFERFQPLGYARFLEQWSGFDES